MTQLKLPSPYARPSRFRPDADAHPPSALRSRPWPHPTLVPGTCAVSFADFFLLWGYVKMAASVLNVLLRRLPYISPFRGAYGVQVTPWGTLCTTSDLVVLSLGRRSTAGNPGTETFPSAYTLAVKETLCFHHPPPSPLIPQYCAFSNLETSVKSQGWMSFSSQVSVSAE